METFGLSAQMGQLLVFLSDKSLLNGQPEPIFYMNYKPESIFRVEGQDCSSVKELDSWLRLFSTKLTYSRVLVDGDASKAGTTVESSKLRHYGVGALQHQAARSKSSGFVGLEREPFHGQDGLEYRRAVWSFREDDGSDLVLNFEFLLNLTQLQRDKGSGYVGRRTVELLSLNSIYWAKPTAGADTKFRSFTLNATSFERSESQPMILPSTCMAALEKAREREEREARVYKDVWIPRGKLTVGSGPDTKEIFIDRQRKLIFSHLESALTCKQITSLKALAGVGPNFQAENDEFSLSKLYGLAALWIRLSELPDVSLKVTNRHDSSGNLFQVNTYSIQGEWATRIPSYWISHAVEVVFVAKKETDATRGKRELDMRLESIKFVPDIVWSIPGSEKSLHQTSIEVEQVQWYHKGT